MRIGFYPEDPDFFYNMKQNLDEGVYERSDFARPHLKSVTITGTGAEVGDIEIQDDGNVIGKAIAQVDGIFSFSFETNYHKEYTIQAIDSSENKSNVLQFDQYNFATLLYLIACKMEEDRTRFGQQKQNIYINEKVGDDIEPLLPMNQPSFSTLLKALKEKFPFGDIGDYLYESERDIYTENIVQKAMFASEKGLLWQSLIYVEELCQELFGDENLNIFLYSNADYGWYLPPTGAGDCSITGTGYEYAFMVSPSGGGNEVLVPDLGVRHKYEYGMLDNPTELGGFHKKITITGAGYTWVYIDGEREENGTWKIKESVTQPIPQAIQKAETTTGVYTDTNGNITGIVDQKYVKSSYSILPDEDLIISGGGNLFHGEVIGGKTIALKSFEDVDSVDISYYTLYEPKILAVIKASGASIEDIHRTYDEIEHTEAHNIYIDKDLEIYIQTGRIYTGLEKDLLHLILRSLLPVGSPNSIFIDKYNLVANPSAESPSGTGMVSVNNWRVSSSITSDAGFGTVKIKEANTFYKYGVVATEFYGDYLFSIAIYCGAPNRTLDKYHINQVDGKETLISSIELPVYLTDIYGIKVTNNYVYIITGLGLWIFNHDLTLVGEDKYIAVYSSHSQFVISDNEQYGWMTADNANEKKIYYIDLSDKANLSHGVAASGQAFFPIALYGDYIFTIYGTTLAVYDASTPTSFNLVDTVTVSSAPCWEAIKIDESAKRLYYLSDGVGSPQVIDISDINNLSVLATGNSSMNGELFTVKDKHLFVVKDTDGVNIEVRVVRVTDYSSLSLGRTYANPTYFDTGKTTGVTFNGNNLFAIGEYDTPLVHIWKIYG